MSTDIIYRYLEEEEGSFEEKRKEILLRALFPKFLILKTK